MRDSLDCGWDGPGKCPKHNYDYENDPVKTEEKMEQFAVVKVGTPSDGYYFKKFHDTHESAKKEACRLAEEEKKKFLVLKLVGHTMSKPNPVEYFVV